MQAINCPMAVRMNQALICQLIKPLLKKVEPKQLYDTYISKANSCCKLCCLEMFLCSRGRLVTHLTENRIMRKEEMRTVYLHKVGGNECQVLLKQPPRHWKKPMRIVSVTQNYEKSSARE